jgi:hypothetical protein
MKIGVFLSIIAALAVVHGIAFIIAPDQVVSLYGLQNTIAVTLMSRLFGGALIAWGAIVWSTKSFRDEAAIRAVLMWTAIANVISVLFVIQSTLSGTMNAMGWVAVLIYLFGVAGCGYFLMGQKRLIAV